MEQLASDATEVTNYLRERFKKDKIYIMAHSGGTAFAIQAVEKSPEMFHAYIGISQITRQAESERLAYKYMTEKYASAGNAASVVSCYVSTGNCVWLAVTNVMLPGIKVNPKHIKTLIAI